MTKHKTVGLNVLALAVLWLMSPRAQEVPASGLYKIISGTYTECCGLAGQHIYSLPNANQSYVQLTVDSQASHAQMALLGADLHTLFSTDPSGLGFRFTFLFTTGVVFPDHIQFETELQVPENLQSWSYTASNSEDGLRINGVAHSPVPGGADIPEDFQHTDIRAVLICAVSKPSIERPRIAANGAIQFTVINDRVGQTNVIEASADLVAWMAISTNVFRATESATCPFIEFEDPASTNLARRFYRSFLLP